MSHKAHKSHAFGVDIGGSGIKGGIVHLETGLLKGKRIRLPTPQPSTPQVVAETVAKIVESAGWDGPVGITLPSVITEGTVRTAANIDPSWIGVHAVDLFSGVLDGREVTVLNDADAAGLAEDKFGAAKDHAGVVLLLTFGTGIGSALIYRGTLVPNTEFGHMEVGGVEAEHRAASSVKDRDNLTYEQWAVEVSRVLEQFEKLLWPEVIVAGGGVSREAEQWVPLLTNATPVVAATLHNTAGIVGAAMAVRDHLKP
ncbi:polyphosphate--glucose phosphotransferase [Nocardia sp. NPDC051030]|uniref:polyphosphate--glucose phosphotransferase n=1 Tax=Nocardia sp. NPDC051030 TaxID=3155162 RepID=UPI0034375AC5